MFGDYNQHVARRRRVVLALAAGLLVLVCLAATALSLRSTRGMIAAILQPTPIPSPTSTPFPTPTCTASPTPEPTATPTPTPEIIEPDDHRWLARPFSPEYNNEPTRFYPYGSTAGGRYRIHRGADFPNPFGAPVLAGARGRVIVAGADHRVVYGERLGFYGQLVIIQLEQEYHGKKVYVLYGHLSEVHVDFLQWVEKGHIIGEVGMSGVAIGPHLHLEVRVGENSYDHTRNPELWLHLLPGKGTIAGQLVDSHRQPMPERRITFYRKQTTEERYEDVTTYPGHELNGDEAWEENFVLGDVPAGHYVAKAYVNGRLYTTEITVREGQTAFVFMEAG